jgi:hypothetical protein
MLHLLFYLLLQLGLLEGQSTDQQTTAPGPNPPTQADAVIKAGTPPGGSGVDTDVSIGGSGWDDKN